MAPESTPALSLRGWIDVTCGREGLVKKSIKYFDEAITFHSQQRYILHTLYIHTPIPSYCHLSISHSSFLQSISAQTIRCPIREVSILLPAPQLQPRSGAGQPSGGQPSHPPPCTSGEDESTAGSPGLGPGSGDCSEVSQIMNNCTVN